MKRPKSRTNRNAKKKKRKKKSASNRRLIAVKDIVVPEWHDPVDFEVACRMADSIKLHGLLNPPIVRNVKQSDGTKKIELVAGATRLDAVELAGKDKVLCRFVKATDDKARLMKGSEDLWRKDMTVLTYAEKVVEWIMRAQVYMNISGQNVQKGRLGRPPRGIAQLAGDLFLLGGHTPDARRKRLVRMSNIAGLTPEAKAKARELKLDDHQDALLAVYKAGQSAIDQVKKVEALAKRIAGAMGGEKGKQPEQGEKSETKALGVHTPTKTGGAGDAAGRDVAVSEPAPTTYLELEAFWKKKGKKLWRYTPAVERARFIAMLQRAPSKVKLDARTFVQEVFQGRQRVNKKEFYALAKLRGLAKKSIREVINLMLHRKKRMGHGWGAEWYFVNADNYSRLYMKVVSDAELKAAVPVEESDETNLPSSDAKTKAYFADI